MRAVVVQDKNKGDRRLMARSADLVTTHRHLSRRTGLERTDGGASVPFCNPSPTGVVPPSMSSCGADAAKDSPDGIRLYSMRISWEFPSLRLRYCSWWLVTQSERKRKSARICMERC